MEDGLNIKTIVMCSSGAHYVDEEHYEKEKADKKSFDKKTDKESDKKIEENIKRIKKLQKLKNRY